MPNKAKKMAVLECLQGVGGTHSLPEIVAVKATNDDCLGPHERNDFGTAPVPRRPHGRLPSRGCRIAAVATMTDAVQWAAQWPVWALAALLITAVYYSGRLVQRVGELGTRMGRLDTRVGGLETRVGELDTRVGGLETRVGELDTRVGELDTRLIRLDEGQADLNQGQADLKAELASLEGRLEVRLSALFGELRAELREDRREYRTQMSKVYGDLADVRVKVATIEAKEEA